MRPESDLAISECMRFFPVYTVIEQIRSVTYEQKIGIGSHLTDSVNRAFFCTANVKTLNEHFRVLNKTKVQWLCSVGCKL